MARRPAIRAARRKIGRLQTKQALKTSKFIRIGGGGGGFSGFDPGGFMGGGRGFDPGPIAPPRFPGGSGGGFNPPTGGGGGISRLCGLLPPGTARELCRAGVDIGEGLIGGGNGGGGGGGSNLGPGCPEGTIKVGNKCIAPGDAFPGGDPFITGAGGEPTLGRYGVAMTPTVEQRAYRRCPEGMRLGKDNLCYDRAVMGRRSNKRKWKAAKKPPITVRQMNALKALESARSAVRDLAGSADLKVQSKAAAARKSGFLKGRGVKTS